MKRQSFFVITRKGKYSSDDDLFWFDDLDKAMSVFKLLVDGATVNVESKEVPKAKKDPTSYVNTENLHYIKSDADYKIENRHINVYSLEEIEKIKKERKEVNS